MSETTMTTWQDQLRDEDACSEALDFANGFATFAEAWRACERGDWMLWWIGRVTRSAPMSPERRPLVRVACACARLALPYVPAGEERPRLAIELAERWANGDDTVTREQMRAYAYADAARFAIAGRAALCTAAAYATAAHAADAAYAAAVAVAAAAYAARSTIWRECADLVRREYPDPPTRGAR